MNKSLYIRKASHIIRNPSTEIALGAVAGIGPRTPSKPSLVELEFSAATNTLKVGSDEYVMDKYQLRKNIKKGSVSLYDLSDGVLVMTLSCGSGVAEAALLMVGALLLVVAFTRLPFLMVFIAAGLLVALYGIWNAVQLKKTSDVLQSLGVAVDERKFLDWQ